MKYSKTILILSLVVISVSIVALAFILVTKTDFADNFNSKVKTLAQKIIPDNDKKLIAQTKSKTVKDVGTDASVDQDTSSDTTTKLDTQIVDNLITQTQTSETISGDLDIKDSKTESLSIVTDDKGIPASVTEVKSESVVVVPVQRKFSVANYDIVYDEDNNRIVKVSDMYASPSTKTDVCDLPSAKKANYLPNSSRRIADGFVPTGISAERINRNYVYDPSKDSQQIEKQKQREVAARPIQTNNQYFEITTSPNAISQVKVRPMPMERTIDSAGVFYDIDTTLKN